MGGRAGKKGKTPGFPLTLAVLVLITGLCGVASLFASGTRLLRLLELRTVDYRFVSRSRPLSPSPDIVLVPLDDASFARIQEPFAFWPSMIAEVAGRLVRDGAKVVGIDVLQDRSLERFVPGQTRKMQEAVLTGRVVLISLLNANGGVVYPLPPVRAAAGLANIGLSDFTPDPDDVMRRQSIYLDDSKGEHLPCFAFLIAAKYLGGEIRQGADSRYRIGNRIIGAESGFVAINYAGPPGSFRSYPFYMVLSRVKRGDDAYLSRTFKNKVVLIGRTDTMGKDFFATPFSVAFNRMMNGIEVHANIVNTLLAGKYFTPMGPAARLSSLFLLSLTVALLCYYLRPLSGTAFTVAVLAAYIGAGFYAFSHFRYVVSFMPLCASIPLVYGSTFAYRYLTVDRRVRQIRAVFGKLVSPSVEEKLWNEDIDPSPGLGEERRVTVLFADINEFTPKCEQYPPDQIMQWLNEFYREMVEVAYRNRGTVKQFVGDEIMVLYGVPRDEPDQAFLAVKTALEMVDRLKQRKRENPAFGFPDVKIGIHTGPMVVGFIGASSRVEYTVIGANVNLASRIENLNKRIGTTILVSEEVYREISRVPAGDLADALGEVEMRDCGPQDLKGFEKKTGVYEIRRKGKDA